MTIPFSGQPSKWDNEPQPITYSLFNADERAASCGELFRRTGFIVTSLALLGLVAVRFSIKRGTAVGWITEGQQGGENRPFRGP